jgi:hypothetical protein
MTMHALLRNIAHEAVNYSPSGAVVVAVVIVVISARAGMSLSLQYLSPLHLLQLQVRIDSKQSAKNQSPHKQHKPVKNKIICHAAAEGFSLKYHSAM